MVALFALVIALILTICLCELLDPVKSPLSALARARKLVAPVLTAIEGGENEGVEFWKRHGKVLRQAWYEWATAIDRRDDMRIDLPKMNEKDVINKALREAVGDVWDLPPPSYGHREEAVRSLFFETNVLGVYRCQLFDPENIKILRRHIDAVSVSEIPVRRPNGMNRYGFILDDSSDGIDGAVSFPELIAFKDLLIDNYVRPIGRMLFPGHVGDGDDEESYVFTIRYNTTGDTRLREHRDSSVVTMNVNLNLPGENYTGSSIYFVGKEDDKSTLTRHNISFEPGMALFHLGSHRHGSYPIVDAERFNLVIWMYGRGGYVRSTPYEMNERLEPKKRWTRKYKKKETEFRFDRT